MFITGVSVEIEPPKAYLNITDNNVNRMIEELDAYIGRVNMISITNRPVFGLSAITTAKKVFNHIKKTESPQTRVSVHMTTRLSHFDLYQAVVNSDMIGLTDILPLLGDPRGPKDQNFFKNGFDLIGFINYLRTGAVKFLSEKYRLMYDKGVLVDHIPNATFNLGTVVDLNPVKLIKNKEIEIREKQLKFAKRKEDLGVDYLISQGIFEARHYFDFIDNIDLKIPIIPGVMPARLRIINQFGMPIHTLDKQRLRAALTTDDEKIEGNKIANRVFQELVDGGCKNIHVYSFGNSKNFDSIVNN